MFKKPAYTCTFWWERGNTHTQNKLTFKHKWQPHITVITTLQAGVKINICHLKKMKEIKFINDTYGSLMLLCEMRMRRGYLRFTSRFQLVFVVAEPFIIETYIFSEGADLLQPHFLSERALYAEALVNNFPLKKHTHTQIYTDTSRARTPQASHRDVCRQHFISSHVQ